MELVWKRGEANFKIQGLTPAIFPGVRRTEEERNGSNKVKNKQAVEKLRFSAHKTMAFPLSLC